MKSIKDFIFYYRSCPLCHSWITLDADLPIPTMLELKPNGVLLTIVKDNHDNNREFFISYDKNKVESNYPFVFNNIANIILRLKIPNYMESFKIEARCYGCSDFRYWSAPIVYNRRSKRLRNFGLAGEKIQFHETNQANEKTSYILSNDYNKKKTLLVVRTHNKFDSDRKQLEINIPFLPFTKLDFTKRQEILVQLQKLAVLG